MSVYKVQAKVGSCPAYDVYRRIPDPVSGLVQITTGDTLGIKVGRGDRAFYRRYSPGSAASYALQYNECPIGAYQRAVEKGHPTHWLNQDSTVICDHEREREAVIEIELGMKVCFEGRVFEIRSTFNNNLELVSVEGAKQ